MWLNGKFPSYSKNSPWDVFVTVPNEVLKALNYLGSSDTRSVADVKPIELFAIQLYCCRQKIPPNNHDLAALKWHVFQTAIGFTESWFTNQRSASTKSSSSTLRCSSVQIILSSFALVARPRRLWLEIG